jgi:hypothetical protein
VLVREGYIGEEAHAKPNTDKKTQQNVAFAILKVEMACNIVEVLCGALSLQIFVVVSFIYT